MPKAVGLLMYSILLFDYLYSLIIKYLEVVLKIFDKV